MSNGEDMEDIEEFIGAMRLKIREAIEDPSKKSWDPQDRYSPVFLRKRLMEEFVEWEEAASDDDERRELLDVANLCFCLWRALAMRTIVIPNRRG